MPDTIRYSPEPSPEVLAYFRNKGIKFGFDWRDVWPQEHAHAFTVAKATELEVLSTIRAAIEDAIRNGVPFEQFRATLEPRLRALGWWGVKNVVDPVTGDTVSAQLGSPRRLKIIYDANIRTANAAGLWERVWRSRETLPFLVYIETTSKEPREEHLEWARKPIVLRVDDPFWETHFPPNGWQCKCSVLQVDEETARAFGWTPDTVAPPLDEVAWFNKRTGDTEMVPKGIDPGWATNPGFTRQRLIEEYLAGRLEDAEPAIKRTVIKDLTSNWLFKKMIEGKFYEFGGRQNGTQFAAPIGVVPAQVFGAAGARNGVVWLTPDKAFSIGRNETTPEEWARATQTLEEGAVIRVQSDAAKPDPTRFGWLKGEQHPDEFQIYRKIKGQYYRVDITLRDRTFDMLPLKDGSRLTIEAFHPVKARDAERAIFLARETGMLVKDEAGYKAPKSAPEPVYKPDTGPGEGLLPPKAGGPAKPGSQPLLPAGAGGPSRPADPSKYQPQIGPAASDPDRGPAGPGDASKYQPYTAPKAAPKRSKKKGTEGDQ